MHTLETQWAIREISSPMPLLGKRNQRLEGMVDVADKVICRRDT
jgi:hypothetical protein